VKFQPQGDKKHMTNKMIPVIYNGERILTTEQLAEVYETDINNIQANFKRNKEHFEEELHYFKLEGEELKEFKNQPTISQMVSKHTSTLYLWTERGANRHCKILDTKKAWEQFDNLEETYFKVKEHKEDLQLYKEIKTQIQGLRKDVKELQETKVIDYTKQLALQNLGKSKVVSALGGINSPAYCNKHIRSKAFSEMWSGYKNRILVNSYRNTAVKDFETGRDYLTMWKPSRKLAAQIQMKNGQTVIHI